MHKHSMHRALLVPEILLIIFKCVTDDEGKPLLPTLVAIARTCRSFQRPVEEILWYELPGISALYNVLPTRMRHKEFRSWSLSRRMFAGPDWARFLDRASRVHVLVEDSTQHDGRSDILLAMAALRDPVLLTPNLRKLEWRTYHTSLGPAINLFIGPSLRSLEVDARLLINHVIRVPIGDTCPRLKHLKITGNARCAASTISGILCSLHCLETAACSTLDNDAFVHLAQLGSLSYLAIDMRWSVLNLDQLHDRLGPGSFPGLQTLYWKDYNVGSLVDMFLMPDVSPPNVYLEIESFCTALSLRTFLHAFAAKFSYTRTFSLVHDTEAGRRFGLQAGTPGREHQLDADDLRPLLALKRLRGLNLVDLGYLVPDDELVKTIASALPELEQLRVCADTLAAASSVTFGGLLALLRRCPELRSVGVSVDAEDMLSFGDTAVRHARVAHLRLEGSVLGSRRAEVDEMLRRVMPGLTTIEESLDGVTWRVRDVTRAAVAATEDREDGGMRTCVRGGRTARDRRTRTLPEEGLR